VYAKKKKENVKDVRNIINHDGLSLCKLLRNMFLQNGNFNTISLLSANDGLFVHQYRVLLAFRYFHLSEWTCFRGVHQCPSNGFRNKFWKIGIKV